ncbi:MAG: carbohydrate-binding domain-containing protein [Lachnospiraceae bacterium]|nr:carbohydrate-binding domain-containing protein [Lachnospiraceae bacterium]
MKRWLAFLLATTMILTTAFGSSAYASEQDTAGSDAVVFTEEETEETAKIAEEELSDEQLQSEEVLQEGALSEEEVCDETMPEETLTGEEDLSDAGSLEDEEDTEDADPADEQDEMPEEVPGFEDTDEFYSATESDEALANDAGAYKKTQENTLFRIQSLAAPKSPSSATAVWNGSYVYFGRYNGQPIKWRILNKYTEDFSEPIGEGLKKTKAPTILLDCDNVLYESPFQSRENDSAKWSKSDVKSDLNGDMFYNKAGVLTGREKEVINESYKQERSQNDGRGLLDIKEETETFQSLNREHIFVLDSVEATNWSYGYSSKISTYKCRVKTDMNGNGKKYWLRSTTPDRIYAGLVINGGLYADKDYNNRYTSNGVSPAMNIDYDSVVLSTLISGKKGESNAAYKFTLKDNDLSIKANHPADLRSSAIYDIDYTITTEGTAKANSVSILILDKDADYYGGMVDTANILYYDRLSTGTDGFKMNGVGSFKLPSNLSIEGWGEDYHVYLLAEDINEEKETDYCSPLCELPGVIKTYPLWVGGEQVTEANMNRLCGGKAEFRPYDNTLTFKDAKIESYYVTPDGHTAAIYSNLGSLNIAGKATISGAEYAIRSDTDRHNERVNVSATLDVTATKNAISASDLRILDGNLKVTAKDGTNPIGIKVSKLTLNGGFAKVSVEGDDCVGIRATELTVNAGSVYIDATGAASKGIKAYTSVIVNGGSISACAHDPSDPSESSSVGIMLDANTNDGRAIFINDGEVYCEGDWYAIGSGGDFTFYIDPRMEIRLPENGKKNDAGTIIVNEDGTAATTVRIGHKDYYVQFKSSSDLKYNGTTERYEVMYTGSKICPAIEVYDRDGKQLKAGANYTVKYSNNKNVDKKGKPAVVTIKFKGNLSGTKKLQFYIVPVPFLPAYVALSDVYVQSGKKVAPVLYYNGRKLTDKDFSVKSKTGRLKFSASDDESNRKITITGKGNFTGSFTDVPVTLRNAAETRAKTIKVNMQKGLSFVYNGKYQPIENYYTVTDAGGNPLDNTYWRSETVGSTLKVGTFKLIVRGINGYTGSVVKKVTIKPDKDRAMMKVIPDPNPVPYTRSGAVPEITIKATSPDSTIRTLTNGTDYSVACSQNKKATTRAKYKITFKGNFKGRAAMTGYYTITPAVLDMDKVSVFATDKIYTKPGKYLSFPYITYNGTPLTKKDVTVTYKVGETDITNVKKYKLTGDFAAVTVTIRGKGNYTTNTDPIVVDGLYYIRKAPSGAINLSKAKITKKGNIKSKIPTQAYTGSEVCSDFDIYVKVGRKWMTAHEAGLSRDLDYRVAYINNKNKGKATVVVYALGESQKAIKSKSTTFKIKTRNMTSMTWYKWLPSL